MSDVIRVSAAEAKQLMDEKGALLVASYESGFMFDGAALDGAIPIDVFRAREAELDNNAEIIFY